MFVDTHCHIHEPTYPLAAEEVLSRARENEVEKMICVGTSEQSSHEAVEFADRHANVFSAIGVHPHDTKDGWSMIQALQSEKIVAVGEIGLDYFYTHSPRLVQIAALEEQLQFAIDRHLPVIFHVREAFEDFWPIFDNFSGLKGVLHSFTDSGDNLDEALSRGLMIGVNGISVFTKDAAQQAVFSRIPLGSLLLETDAPFLTPPPFRGKVNEPAFVSYVGEHHANIRDISPRTLADTTTANAHALFAI